MTGYPSVGRFEADDAVVGSGAQDGADGLGAQGDGADAGGDGYGGAAAGTAGRVGRVPGVEGGGGVKAGKFGGDGFAHHNGAGVFQAGQNGGVIVGDEIGVDLGAGGGGNAGGIENVFDADGYAVEGAGLGQGIEFALALLGVGEDGFAVQVDPCLEGLQGFGAGKQGFGGVYDGGLAVADLAGQLGGGQFVQFGHRFSSRVRFGMGNPAAGF